MPTLAHSIPTLMDLKICMVSLNKKRLEFESVIVLAIALLGKLFSEIAFFTNVIDLQAALSACLTVRDWETKPFSPIYIEEMKNY